MSSGSRRSRTTWRDGVKPNRLGLLGADFFKKFKKGLYLFIKYFENK